jgi:hypothetical protein
MKLNQTQCANCPFREDGNELPLNPDYFDRIKDYLYEGQNHLCHNDRRNATICRGGRLYQLEQWARTGTIATPTHACLADAMRKTGVEPAAHITDNIGNP